MICGDCKFWIGDNMTERAACRRYPPEAGGVVMQQSIQGPMPVIIWARPETFRADFCGEWAQAEPAIRLAS